MRPLMRNRVARVTILVGVGISLSLTLVPSKVSQAASQKETDKRTVVGQFTNPADAPLKITKFSVEYSKRPRAEESGADPYVGLIKDTYTMSASWFVENTANRAVKQEMFRFTDTKNGHLFHITEDKQIGVSKNPALNKVQDFYIYSLLIEDDPSDLNVELESVIFADGSKWGDYKDRTIEEYNGGRLAIGDLSTEERPSVLSWPKFKHEPYSLTPAVSGNVVLRVAFRVDGSIQVIGVINPVPGGRTAEAIRLVERLTCKPATKEGKPFEFESPFEVSFYVHVLSSNVRTGEIVFGMPKATHHSR